MMTESVDSARTMILHASRLEPQKIIMIASAMKGEGKTTLSCLLSASMHRAGRKTLLIDGDLRCPAIHKVIDCVPGSGLSELLRNEVRLDEVIMPAVGSGFDYLPAGKVDGEALRGIVDGRLGELLSELRCRYDQIIIDSPPTLFVSDAAMIAQHVDSVVMSVLREVSQAPKVYAAYEQLSELNVRILGAVVGGARTEETFGHGYSYGYGYGYGPNQQASLT